VESILPPEIKVGMAGINFATVTADAGSKSIITYNPDESVDNQTNFKNLNINVEMAKTALKIGELSFTTKQLVATDKPLLSTSGSVKISNINLQSDTVKELSDFLAKNPANLEYTGAIDLNLQNPDQPMPERAEVTAFKLSLGSYLTQMNGKFEVELKDNEPVLFGEGVVQMNDLLPLMDEIKALGKAPEADIEQAKAFITNFENATGPAKDGLYSVTIKAEKGSEPTINGMSAEEFRAKLVDGVPTQAESGETPDIQKGVIPEGVIPDQQKPAVPTAPATKE